MKNGIFICVLFCLPLLGLSQIGDVILPQTSVIATKYTSSTLNIKDAALDKTLRTLAQKITRSEFSDEQKARAIFIWVANNIDYDNELHNSRSLQKKIYTSEENVIRHVLKRNKALCGGYAFLFERLCDAVGISAQTIHGFSQQYKVSSNNKPNHTWNAVKVNGQWHLLDITWAKSHSRDGTPNLFWFKTSPSDFIKTHVPEDHKWQLL